MFIVLFFVLSQGGYLSVLETFSNDQLFSRELVTFFFKLRQQGTVRENKVSRHII